MLYTFNQNLPWGLVRKANKQIKRTCTKCGRRLGYYNPNEQCLFHMEDAIRDMDKLTTKEILSWVGPVKTGVL